MPLVYQDLAKKKSRFLVEAAIKNYLLQIPKIKKTEATKDQPINTAKKLSNTDRRLNFPSWSKLIMKISGSIFPNGERADITIKYIIIIVSNNNNPNQPFK